VQLKDWFDFRNHVCIVSSVTRFSFCILWAVALYDVPPLFLDVWQSSLNCDCLSGVSQGRGLEMPEVLVIIAVMVLL
jgi:hypothetical protein